MSPSLCNTGKDQSFLLELRVDDVTVTNPVDMEGRVIGKNVPSGIGLAHSRSRVMPSQSSALRGNAIFTRSESAIVRGESEVSCSCPVRYRASNPCGRERKQRQCDHPDQGHENSPDSSLKLSPEHASPSGGPASQGALRKGFSPFQNHALNICNTIRQRSWSRLKNDW